MTRTDTKYLVAFRMVSWIVFSGIFMEQLNIKDPDTTAEGRRDLVSAIEQTKLDVRHYAKRQLTWFRREPGVVWCEGFGDDQLLRQQVLRLIVPLD